MSTNTITMPTPGIAGRYFVQERRKRFSNLIGRVFVVFENRHGYDAVGYISIESKDILSPRRLYRKFVALCDDINQYPKESQNNIANTINELTDATFLWMRRWSLDGFPESEDGFFHKIELPVRARSIDMEMNLWSSDFN